MFNDQLWESSFGSKIVEKMKNLGLSEGKTVHFPFHDSNVYFITITTKRHQNNSEESCWQIGYPQLVTDSMGAVLRQLVSTNQTELVIWKPKPSIHALKNKGNEGADDWCRFENAYVQLQLMKPEYGKINIKIIENNYERNATPKEFLIDEYAEDKIAELTTKGRKTTNQPKVHRKTLAAAKKKMRSRK